jgi:hypothetical protein
MRARRLAMLAVLTALTLPACKPPPTDEGSARAANMPAPRGPSEPLASPVVEGAIWAMSAKPGRLVYGIPGKPVLVALECLDASRLEARLRITRHAPADPGAGALLAVIGNGAIGRFEVDATTIGQARLWQGEAPATAQGWNALDGPREATVTVPGAGLVLLNPSPLPGELLKVCRAPALPADQA